MIWPRTNYYIVYRPLECFHSRGQHLCKFIRTKESVCIRKEFNSHRAVWDTNMASVSLFWDTNMAAMTSCENTLYSLFETPFWTDNFLPLQPDGIVQILLQIALLFTAQKLARFRESRINERLIRETFCPFKICPNPCKRGLGNWV